MPTLSNKQANETIGEKRRPFVKHTQVKGRRDAAFHRHVPGLVLVHVFIYPGSILDTYFRPTAMWDLAAQDPKTWFRICDADGDRRLSRDEVVAALKAQLPLAAGLMLTPDQ